MQSYAFLLSDTSIAPVPSGIASQKSQKAPQPVEVDAKPERPAGPRRTGPPLPRSQRSRCVSVCVARCWSSFRSCWLLAARQYYLAEEPTSRRTMPSSARAKESLVNARVAGQVVKIAVIDNQRVRKGAAPVPNRSRTIPDCRRSSRGPAWQCPSPDQRAQGDFPPATGRASISQGFRGLRPT